MAHSSSIELTGADTDRLLAIAREAIEHGAATGRAPAPPAERHAPFGEPAATFVTLTQRGALRGCMGALEAVATLAASVSGNAFNAAIRDPRFPSLTPAETAYTRIEVSVLSPLEPVPAVTEAELLAALRPGIDGLLIDEAGRRATFLPKVWEQLPDPQDFLTHLKVKGGLPPGHWSADMLCYRYTTLTFGEAELAPVGTA